jgi:hypothetical protein
MVGSSNFLGIFAFNTRMIPSPRGSRGAHTPHRQEGFPQLRRQLRLGLGFEGRHAHSVAGGQQHHVAGGEFLAEKAGSKLLI